MCGELDPLHIPRQTVLTPRLLIVTKTTMTPQTQYPVPPAVFSAENFRSISCSTTIAASGGASQEEQLSVGAEDFYVTSIMVTTIGNNGVLLHEFRDTGDMVLCNIKRSDGTSYTGSPVDIRALNRLSTNNPLWRGWRIPAQTILIVQTSHVAVGTPVISFTNPLRVDLHLSGYKYMAPKS